MENFNTILVFSFHFILKKNIKVCVYGSKYVIFPDLALEYMEDCLYIADCQRGKDTYSKFYYRF